MYAHRNTSFNLVRADIYISVGVWYLFNLIFLFFSYLLNPILILCHIFLKACKIGTKEKEEANGKRKDIKWETNF